MDDDPGSLSRSRFLPTINELPGNGPSRLFAAGSLAGPRLVALFIVRHMRFRIRFTLIVRIAVGVSWCVGGCGEGYVGGDDVQPGACARGTALAFVPQTTPSRDSTERIRIYLMRGYQNEYSLGLDQIADQLRALNFAPKVIGWPEWMEAADSIIAEDPSLPEGTEYMLVGHSYGADDAIRMALILRDNNIRVKMLFLIDATVPEPIPDNVDQCIHYYYPWLPGFLAPWFFSGNPVIAEAGNTHTRITNLLFTREALGDVVGCANHFSIEANQYMQNRVIEAAIQLLDD